MMPLSMAKSGERNLIKMITGKAELRSHLANLGFVSGESVTVVAEMSGNLILGIKGTRIALDKSMANHIMV